ncbi:MULTISPECIES: xanthine dehydrogenase accessory protein XdhC [Pseudomonas]|uniref:Xanthine dehydrogenase accessory protein XdhC n=1 Tax=Pseudomonas quercus TaxID=2722792 RepID=A0ABX0Y9H0_9PSED|nr:MULTISPECIES: xanthine dehydrogenase accessory protein XdhC [Pseudomonas]MBF7141446.1 xanthine dehydrogenase accessory protein XdhC [Pseudomonas sp. LY10J]NJO99984.1 xanthine dehydrogenase accessory protein XdhC [Pseudomonas quercus]
MSDWIGALAQHHAAGEPCVLVTLIEERGSTPRNAGAKMVVTPQEAFDTIGGGNLEFKALAIARELLARGERQSRLERFSLGASLGQCCGGAAVVLFEPLGQPQAHITVFGAGHVGRALVPLLASLPCRVRWVDARSREFPAVLPAGVETIVNDDPVEEVDRLRPGSYCLVMTHDHQLDLALSEAILRRGDTQWFGLIGSKTKRARFEHRLRDRGLAAEALARMRCPVGLDAVKGKLPMEIAVSIAAEIISLYNARFGEASQGGETLTRLVSPSRRHSSL